MNNLYMLSSIFFVAGLISGSLLVFMFLRLRYSRELNATQLKNSFLETTAQELKQILEKERDDNRSLSIDNASLKSRLDSDKLRFEEQIELLQGARTSLSQEFENLANRIFEEKQTSFTRHSRQTLETTVDPLRKELSIFKQRVEDVYDKESSERNKLVGQISELQKQAQRIGDDAIQLANALKGDSKVQGNWGEVILERLLEESGLTKGREYEVQVSLKDASGQRRNPDVILHLPDQRDIVIDAKVSLTDYERFCRSEDEEQRQQFLRAHLASIRSHVSGLNRKAYEQLSGVNSLDFVFIFVPIEAALMLAIEHDHNLFSYAYDRGIILVSPSTLLATLRTVHNIWRYEDQNRNAEKIAAQAGAIYDQLVLMVEAIEATGQQLDKAREAWTTSHKRLVSGRGNLVKKINDLKTMGARTRDKQLPKALLEEALIEDSSKEVAQGSLVNESSGDSENGTREASEYDSNPSEG